MTRYSKEPKHSTRHGLAAIMNQMKWHAPPRWFTADQLPEAKGENILPMTIELRIDYAKIDGLKSLMNSTYGDLDAAVSLAVRRFLRQIAMRGSLKIERVARGEKDHELHVRVLVKNPNE